jgi:hypothetical protein
MIALIQNADPVDVQAAIGELAGRDSRLGIGLRRERLSGAQRSVGDAERALAVAEIRGRANCRSERQPSGCSCTETVSSIA